jgi:hypothetical protein
MRYIKLRTIITKTTDAIVDEVSDIKAILFVLTDKELDCCLKLKNGPRMELTRILDLDEDTFRFQAITKTASMIRRVKYADIELIEVHDFASDIVLKKPRVSRWMMIEPVTILESDND